jgi:hypothetical protein
MKLKVTPNCKSRKEYIEHCKLMLADHKIRTSGKFVHQYKNDGKGRRQGVVCAFIERDTLFVGASKANRRLNDRFDPNIGLWQAVKEATLIDDCFPEDIHELHDGPGYLRDRFDHLFPLSMHKIVCRMIFRGRRQFFPKPKEVTTLEPARA